MRKWTATAFALAGLMVAPVAAQTANPLNPRSGSPANTAPPSSRVQTAPQQAAPVEPGETRPRRAPRTKTDTQDQDTASKPKRAMSPAQKRNADIMRACGAEWREQRDALKAKGETWRTFLAACRKRQTA